jgi:hypothetical protein
MPSLYDRFLHKTNEDSIEAVILCSSISSRASTSRPEDLLNKHCSQILQETLLNSVPDDLLPFMVGHGHDNFTLLTVKDVMLFQHCQLVIKMLFTGYRQKAL